MSELTREALDELQTFASKYAAADNRIDKMDMEHELVTRLLYWRDALLDAAERGIDCEARMRILHDIGVTQSDFDEMWRRFNGAGRGEGGDDGYGG